ncbi:MAG: hypothetical protein R2873_03150 [Caldilineaceae bacterium]
MRWILDELLACTDLPIEVQQDPNRMRPSDVPVSICDNSRLVAAIGWQPEVDLRRTLQEILDSWRKEIKSLP